MKKSLLYIILRLANTLLTIAWGFGVTAILLRTVGVESFSFFILVSVIGIYLAGSNFGISELLYAHFRKELVTGNINEIGHFAQTAISLYFALTTLTSFVFLGFIYITKYGGDHQIAIIAFFSVTILNFPWIVIKALSEAIDLYIYFEIVDLLRRVLQALCLLTILINVSPTIAFSFSTLIWLLAYLTILPHLLKKLGLRWQAGWIPTRKNVYLFGQQYGSQIRPSIVFSLSEFSIYNYAYVFVPLVFGGGVILVLYDVFYKLVRAAISLNMVASGALMPHLTRAYHKERTPETYRIFAFVLGISICAMFLLASSLVLGNNLLFQILLDGQIKIGWTFTIPIIIVAFANAIQNSSGAFIIRVGHVEHAQNLAVTMLTSMFLLALFVWITERSFDQFLFGFALVYAAGSIAWLAIALRIISRASHPKASPLKGSNNETSSR